MPFKNEERIFPRDYENRIFCEDCLTFMKEIPDESVFLILTDPPYGIHYSNQFAKNPHAMLPGDDGIDYPAFARESYRILRMNSHAYFLPVLTAIRTIFNACRKLALPSKIAW